MNSQFWPFEPVGALSASSMQRSTMRSSTGSGRTFRTARWVSITVLQRGAEAGEHLVDRVAGVARSTSSTFRRRAGGSGIALDVVTVSLGVLLVGSVVGDAW